jgi:hypothetical protein
VVGREANKESIDMSYLSLRDGLSAAIQYALDKSDPDFAALLERYMTTSEGLLIRFSRVGDNFELELPSSHVIQLSSSAEQLQSQLFHLLSEQRKVTDSELSLFEYKQKTRIGEKASPIQYEIDKIKKFTKTGRRDYLAEWERSFDNE